MKRVIATDGNSEPLIGTCVFFLRPNNLKQLSTSNMADVREDTNNHRLYELHFVFFALGINLWYIGC